MQITVFGASGKVGSLVVEEALRRDYSVVAFVHSHSLFVPSGKLRVVQGDIYKPADVAQALHGSDAVISCLGSWGTPRKNVLTAAVRNIIPAMQAQQMKRIITLTGSGAIEPSRKPSIAHTLLLTLLAPFPAGKVFHDGEEHMQLLAASGLDWTTLRSPIMSNLGGAAYRLAPKVQNQLATISRKAVVSALLDQVADTTQVRQAPVIHRA